MLGINFRHTLSVYAGAVLLAACGACTPNSAVGTVTTAPPRSTRLADIPVKFYSIRAGRRVVYVIDRSGSMFDTFDYVQAELKRSIRRLKPTQYFHIIFFAVGEPDENTPKMMVPATGVNKKQVYKYIDGITAEGQTKPLRAIERAFAVKNKKGKHAQLIYLLTDGEFDPEALKKIKQMQVKLKTKIKINTISFVYRGGEKILKQIAAENGGTYTFVSPDDLGR